MASNNPANANSELARALLTIAGAICTGQSASQGSSQGGPNPTSSVTTGNAPQPLATDPNMDLTGPSSTHSSTTNRYLAI